MLRAELVAMRPSALRRRAVALGCADSDLEAADDAEDVKSALIELISQRADQPTDSAPRRPAWSISPDALDELSRVADLYEEHAKKLQKLKFKLHTSRAAEDAAAAQRATQEAEQKATARSTIAAQQAAARQATADAARMRAEETAAQARVAELETQLAGLQTEMAAAQSTAAAAATQQAEEASRIAVERQEAAVAAAIATAETEAASRIDHAERRVAEIQMEAAAAAKQQEETLSTTAGLGTSDAKKEPGDEDDEEDEDDPMGAMPASGAKGSFGITVDGQEFKVSKSETMGSVKRRLSVTTGITPEQMALLLGGDSNGSTNDDECTVAAAGVLTPETSIRLPQHASRLQCQYGGRKTFEPVLLQLKRGVLSWRDDMTGEECRTASVMGCQVATPKKARKGHPYAFRLDLSDRDSGKDVKHVFSVADEQELRLWMDSIGAYSRMTAADVEAVETAAAEMTKLALSQLTVLAESDEDEDDATPRATSARTAAPAGVAVEQVAPPAEARVDKKPANRKATEEDAEAARVAAAVAAAEEEAARVAIEQEAARVAAEEEAAAKLKAKEDAARIAAAAAAEEEAARVAIEQEAVRVAAEEEEAAAVKATEDAARIAAAAAAEAATPRVETRVERKLAIKTTAAQAVEHKAGRAVEAIAAKKAEAVQLTCAQPEREVTVHTEPERPPVAAKQVKVVPADAAAQADVTSPRRPRSSTAAWLEASREGAQVTSDELLAAAGNAPQAHVTLRETAYPKPQQASATQSLSPDRWLEASRDEAAQLASLLAAADEAPSAKIASNERGRKYAEEAAAKMKANEDAEAARFAKKEKGMKHAEEAAAKPKAAEDAEAARIASKERGRKYAEEAAAKLKANEDAEAARVAAAAEEEAARVAAEEEAAAAKAKEDAARIAAEEEAARVAIEQEAVRVAAEEEAAAKLRDKVDAARVAAAEEEVVAGADASDELDAKEAAPEEVEIGASVRGMAAAWNTGVVTGVSLSEMREEEERSGQKFQVTLPTTRPKAAPARRSGMVALAAQRVAGAERAAEHSGALAEGVPPTQPKEDSATAGTSSVPPAADSAARLYSDDVVYYHDGGQSKMQEVAGIWDRVDPDRSGSLDQDEVQVVLAQMGVESGDDEVSQAMAQLDSDGDGEISFDEFASWYLTYADESETQVETTVAGLADLAATGAVSDETYIWSAGLGDDWMSLGAAEALVGPIQSFAASPSTRPPSDKQVEQQVVATALESEEESDAARGQTQRAEEAASEGSPSRRIKHDAVVYYQDGGATQAQRMETLWESIDVDGSGSLDHDEVESMLEVLGVPAAEMDVDAAMSEIDADGDGSVDFDEFVAWYQQRNEDEAGQQAVTTVAGLGDLLDAGVLTGDTYMWVEALGGEDWMTYDETKHLLPTPTECRSAAAEAAASAEVAAAQKRARAMQIIGTLEGSSPVYYAVGGAPADGEEAPRAQTTVAELHDLVTSGDITDETLMWAEGMDETWLQYQTVKPLLPGPKASDATVTIMYADGTTRSTTVGEISQLYASGEIQDDTNIRVDGEEEFQSLADARASSPRDGGPDGEATGIGAAMEQANAEAWERAEVRRLHAVDNLKEAQTRLNSLLFDLLEAEEDGDEAQAATIKAEIAELQERITALKSELDWLEGEVKRISDQLALVFGEQAAKNFLRSRSLAMAVMQDDVLANASKDLAAAAKGALANTEEGQLNVSSLLSSAVGSLGGGGGLSGRARSVSMSLSSLSESHSDAIALVGAAQAGKDSSTAGATQLAKVQAQLEELQKNGEELSGADDISRMLVEHPELLVDIKKLISIYTEDTVMGMKMPDITGDKDWGRYSLHNLRISKVMLPPEGLDLIIGSGVAVTIKGVRAELAEFVWHYAKTRGFPKLKDDGVATAAISGLDIDVSFDIIADGAGGIMLSNMEGNVCLADLQVLYA
jgi:Ca2+-binding EF-hand superfamily protein